jgi:hypothetical protein
MNYQPMDPDQIRAVMTRGSDLTDEHFYDMIEESLNESVESRQWPYYALDFVASREDWAAFKAAMTRWLADKDAEHAEGFDQADAEYAAEREDRHLKPVKD